MNTTAKKNPNKLFDMILTSDVTGFVAQSCHIFHLVRFDSLRSGSDGMGKLFVFFQIGEPRPSPCHSDFFAKYLAILGFKEQLCLSELGNNYKIFGKQRFD